MFRVKEKNGRETQFGKFLGSSLGTGNVLFSVLTSFGIFFFHNLLISDLNGVIQNSG